MQCTNCRSRNYISNSLHKGVRRCKCKECSRCFSDKVRKITYQNTERFLQLYINVPDCLFWKMGSNRCMFIGKGGYRAIALYNKAKLAVGAIEYIYTDGNSCYCEAFTEYSIKKLIP